VGERTIWDASIRAEGIELAPYDFPGLSFHPQGLCRWDEVREIDPRAWPPEVRTAREVLFIPAAVKGELEPAARARGIASVGRLDVWGLLLEPFLDTAFDTAGRERTYAALERADISRESCDALRDELAPAMVAYNLDSMLWDWSHLGLCDALSALRGHLGGPRLRLPDAEFAAFYRKAMAIALGAPTLTG
jgi:hypothetical protein